MAGTPLPASSTAAPRTPGAVGPGARTAEAPVPSIRRCHTGVVCDRGELVGMFTSPEFAAAPRDGRLFILLDRAPPPGELRQVVVGQQTLAILEFRCMTCGHLGGWAFSGEPARLPRRLLGQLQAAVGLPPVPLLRSTSAWTHALAEK